jgi:hypothetical protein
VVVSRQTCCIHLVNLCLKILIWVGGYDSGSWCRRAALGSAGFHESLQQTRCRASIRLRARLLARGGAFGEIEGHHLFIEAGGKIRKTVAKGMVLFPRRSKAGFPSCPVDCRRRVRDVDKKRRRP